jgi:hypothetical protein
LCFHLREHISFLCHTYPESSGKGKSACQFTLGQVYLIMGEKGNERLTYEFFDEKELENKTNVDTLLKRTRDRARGKKERKNKSKTWNNAEFYDKHSKSI